MNYFGLVYKEYIYFVEDKALIGTYADMIAAQMLAELLAFQLESEEGEQDGSN